MAKKEKCIKRNSVGDCLEWAEDEKTGELTATFPDQLKECNPELHDQFKEKFRARKIKILLED